MIDTSGPLFVGGFAVFLTTLFFLLYPRKKQPNNVIRLAPEPKEPEMMDLDEALDEIEKENQWALDSDDPAAAVANLLRMDKYKREKDSE